MVGAYLGGRLTGMGALKQMDYAEIKRMFVEPEQRGKGIAKDSNNLGEIASTNGSTLYASGSKHTAYGFIPVWVITALNSLAIIR